MIESLGCFAELILLSASQTDNPHLWELQEDCSSGSSLPDLGPGLLRR